MAASKILLVHHFRTAATRRVLRSLVKALACDAEEIVDMPKPGPLRRFANAVFGTVGLRRSGLEREPKNPSDYDLIVIGAAVGAGEPAAPMQAYLEKNRANIRQVAYFCALDADGDMSAVAEICRIGKRTPRAVCAVSRGEVASGEYSSGLREFVQAIAG